MFSRLPSSHFKPRSRIISTAFSTVPLGTIELSSFEVKFFVVKGLQVDTLLHFDKDFLNTTLRHDMARIIRFPTSMVSSGSDFDLFDF